VIAPLLMRHCKTCQKRFYVEGRTVFTGKNKNIFCSRPCKAQAQKGKPPGFKQTIAPEADINARLRANWMIAKAVRDNPEIKPANCVKCGRGECRIDGHHPDHSQPYLIAWLCRSCHMKAHRSAEFEKQCADLARRVLA
jgi:hypothetical protein